MKKVFLGMLVFFFMSNSMLAQIEISGTVKDERGEPLSGATILVQATEVRTQTAADGLFNLKVADTMAVLIVSYREVAKKLIPVGNKTTFNIVLDMHEGDVDKSSGPIPADYSTVGTPKKNYAQVQVFFATDRKAITNTEPDKMFGTKRSTMSYGTCKVSIPRDHRMGELEAPSIWSLEFKNDPEKHVTLINVEVKNKDAFFANMKTRIAKSPQKNAFLFVHGYNVSFEDAARRTAQMSYDLGFDGAPVFYSWPSQATLAGYNVDEGNIEWSKANLKTFLEDFLTKSDAQNIYLIAHSMGNRGLTGALADIIRLHPEMMKRIKEVILAAPDIDAAVFKRDIAPILIKGKKPITLYTSSNDVALEASQEFSNYPRAGQAGKDMIVLPGIDTIDASKVKTDFMGHSYFSDSTQLLSDIFVIIHKGQRPDKRSGLKKVLKKGVPTWAFKD